MVSALLVGHQETSFFASFPSAVLRAPSVLRLVPHDDSVAAAAPCVPYSQKS